VDTTTVFQAALALPESIRIELVEQLLEGLGPETDGVDEHALLSELRCQSDELEQGTGVDTIGRELENE
jgi:hypothetical protein